MGNIFDSSFHATEFQKINIDYVKYFAVDENFDQSNPSKLIDQVHQYMQDEHFDRFLSTKRRNQTYLKDRHANEIFLKLRQQFPEISVVVLFDAIPSYFELDHRGYWLQLTPDFQALLLLALSKRITIRHELDDHTSKMKKDGVYEPKLD